MGAHVSKYAGMKGSGKMGSLTRGTGIYETSYSFAGHNQHMSNVHVVVVGQGEGITCECILSFCETFELLGFV